MDPLQARADHVAASEAVRSVALVPMKRLASPRLEAKDIDATKAKRLIAHGLWAYVNAKRDKLVMTSLNGPGYASFTLIHEKSPTRGDLFRCDTINFDAATMTPVHGLTRIEISNEKGNWEMCDAPNMEGIALLIRANETPVDTIGLRGEFKEAARGMESPENSSTYKISDGTVDGRPVINIEQADAGGAATCYFAIDAANGNLLSMVSPVDGLHRYFELNPKIDETDFDIPDSRIVAPVADGLAAKRYLEDHK